MIIPTLVWILVTTLPGSLPVSGSHYTTAAACDTALAAYLSSPNHGDASCQRHVNKVEKRSRELAAPR